MTAEAPDRSEAGQAVPLVLAVVVLAVVVLLALVPLARASQQRAAARTAADAAALAGAAEGEDAAGDMAAANGAELVVVARRGPSGMGRRGARWGAAAEAKARRDG